MKIGIFGGSFNPPHNMHKNIALDLINNGYVDKVIYIPVGDNYNKKELISFKDRYEMLSLMIEEYSNLDVSDIGSDINYQFTYQTLDYFKSINNKDLIYFICGTDNLALFDTWKRYEYILNNYKLLVIKRNHDDIEYLLDKYKDYKDNIIITNVTPKVLSSSFIRSNIDNKKVKENLDHKVYKYIKR